MTRPGLLITAEGLDRAGTSRTLELLAPWIERRGHRVEIVQPVPSKAVKHAAGSRRSRPFLDARIASLLAAAELERTTVASVRHGLARGSVILADRYAWTATARNVARGLDPAWSRNLLRFVPRPDLSIYLRRTADDAIHLTLDEGPANGALAAAAGSLRPFLHRIVVELDSLASSTNRPAAEPWPVPAITIDARAPLGASLEVAREAIRPLLAARRPGRPPTPPAAAGDEPGSGPEGRLPQAAPGGHGEPGRLIVLEGIDHAGRSTQARLLEQHLRYTGRGVVRTSFGGSVIAGELLRRAKTERGWDPSSVVLLYAADLAERLEHVVRPALRAGLTVIADRYAYTPTARAVARGVDRGWVEGLFEFAPPPDIVLLLDLPPSSAAARTSADAGVGGRGLPGADRIDDYERFQTLVAGWFLDAASRLGFTTVPADRAAQTVQASLQAAVGPLFDPAAGPSAR
jgi:dTMP kinase